MTVGDQPDPAATRANVLHALSRSSTHLLGPPEALALERWRGRPGCAVRAPARESFDRVEAALSHSYYAMPLVRLIQGHRECTAGARLPKSIRTALRELQAFDVIGVERGVYRASPIALYSSYQLPALSAPPIHAPTND